MAVASRVRSRARSEGSERASYPGNGGAAGAGLAGGAVFVVTVAFVAGAVFVAVAAQFGDGPAGPAPAGWSGVQTCSAALVLTLSAVSRSWPIPAKTARNTTTGASLMRSLTCGIGMAFSLACVPAARLAGEWRPGV